MDKINVIAVFDIGKTNKKLLLFDEQMNVVEQREDKFPTTVDEDGFECDDIELIEQWLVKSVGSLINEKQYLIKALNFSTYGASLAFLNKEGQRLTPIYNYLKEIDPAIQAELFERHGGEAEFCRQTASPALGSMLNSGVQLLWLKKNHPELIKKVEAVLHFPQYLSYLFTKRIVSESTSIGCHTFMWDYDHNRYHSWLKDQQISLPEPVPNNDCITIDVESQSLQVGVGIHDSSASLVPYLKASKEPFVLISTGTWCINMNPFNHSPLTAEQLKCDCLSYMSIDQKPVKSSRLFMGHLHDVNTARLVKHFNVPANSYKTVQTNDALLKSYLDDAATNKVFFKHGMPDNYIDDVCDLKQFESFDEAYHRLMFDLTMLNAASIALISDSNDQVKRIYVSGGFARNEIFVKLMASLYSDKTVFTSEIDNASALGAALVVWHAMAEKDIPEINLGLKEWKPL
jgi:sugar (pentulose or hexulose) kinase